MAKHNEHFTALILDDNPGDAVVLKQMLASTRLINVKPSIHHSSQGLFPSSGVSFDWVFLADNYASSDPAQLVGVAQAHYPQAQIVLSSEGSVNAQELLAAARSGLAQIIDKDTLSRSLLDHTLEALLADQAPAAPATKSSGLALAVAGASAHESEHTRIATPATRNQNSAPAPSRMPEQSSGSTDWNELTTGIVALENNGKDWLIRSINRAAAEQENLDPAALIGTSLTDAPFNYQNLKLSEQLLEIQENETLRFTDVLQIDADGQASWRDITATRNASKGMLLELHASTHHSAAEESKDDTQSIWRHIVSSYPDLSALIDEDGSIIELISGDWQTIQSDTEALKGQTLSSLINEEHRQSSRELLSKALNTGKAQQTVFRLELSDGPIWLHSTLSLLRTPAATQRTALLVASDVTEMFERHQAGSAELETMKEFTRRMPFALAIKDTDGRFERANPYFLDLFGLRSDDVIGKAEADLFPEHLTAQLVALEQQMHRSNDVVEASVQVDPDDWMVYRFIKLPLHNDVDNNLASCLLVLPSDGEDQISPSVPAPESSRSKQLAGRAASKKKSPRLKTNKQ